jgi:hypothetical protein
MNTQKKQINLDVTGGFLDGSFLYIFVSLIIHFLAKLYVLYFCAFSIAIPYKQMNQLLYEKI